jgi:hypothetical protein
MILPFLIEEQRRRRPMAKRPKKGRNKQRMKRKKMAVVGDRMNKKWQNGMDWAGPKWNGHWANPDSRANRRNGRRRELRNGK